MIIVDYYGGIESDSLIRVNVKRMEENYTFRYCQN